MTSPSKFGSVIYRNAPPKNRVPSINVVEQNSSASAPIAQEAAASPVLSTPQTISPTKNTKNVTSSTVDGVHVTTGKFAVSKRNSARRSKGRSAQKNQSSSKDASDPDKRDRLREKVLLEIVETEEKYLSDLVTMMIYYIRPLKDGSRFPELDSSNKSTVKVMFSTIELILDGNNKLMDSIRDEMSTPTPLIGKIFLQMADTLCQYYGVFCNHQKEAMDGIDTLMKSSPAFKAFLDSCMQKTETKGLGLLDYLVKPFQRLLKYPLLLRELLRYTPAEHPDHQNLVEALGKLEKEVDIINSQKAQNDNMKKLLEINQNVDSMPRGFRLIVSSRLFVYEGTLMKISGNHDQERHFFLFNDCLMYCKKKSTNKYTFRGLIYLHKLRIEDMENNPTSWKIHRSDKNLVYTLYGKAANEKTAWLSQIRGQQEKISSGRKSAEGPNSGVKREIVRVYIAESGNEFKSFAITMETTATELFNDCVKKVNMNKTVPAMGNDLVAVVNGQERVLQPSDRPLEVQQNYIADGVKFGDDTNHFRMKANLESSVNSPLVKTPSGDSVGMSSSPSTTILATSPSTTTLASSPSNVSNSPTSPSVLKKPPIPNRTVPAVPVRAATTTKLNEKAATALDNTKASSSTATQPIPIARGASTFNLTRSLPTPPVSTSPSVQAPPRVGTPTGKVGSPASPQIRALPKPPIPPKAPTEGSPKTSPRGPLPTPGSPARPQRQP